MEHGVNEERSVSPRQETVKDSRFFAIECTKKERINESACQRSIQREKLCYSISEARISSALDLNV